MFRTHTRPHRFTGYLVWSWRPLAIMLHGLHHLITHLIWESWKPVNIWTGLRDRGTEVRPLSSYTCVFFGCPDLNSQVIKTKQTEMWQSEERPMWVLQRAEVKPEVLGSRKTVFTTPQRFQTSIIINISAGTETMSTAHHASLFMCLRKYSSFFLLTIIGRFYIFSKIQQTPFPMSSRRSAG